MTRRARHIIATKSMSMLSSTDFAFFAMSRNGCNQALMRIRQRRFAAYTAQHAQRLCSDWFVFDAGRTSSSNRSTPLYHNHSGGNAETNAWEIEPSWLLNHGVCNVDIPRDSRQVCLEDRSSNTSTSDRAWDVTAVSHDAASKITDWLEG